MSDVPADVIRNLLLLLPSDDLARFRSVCKSWKRTIDDADFAKSHLLSQMDGGDNLIISDQINLYSMSLTSLYYPETKTIELKTLRNLTNVGVRLRDFPIASCDGLVVVSGDKGLALWNILTGECRKLPSCHRDRSKGCWESVGFGYDKISDDYKVVRMFTHHQQPMKTMVYSLKSDEWHRIEDCFNYRAPFSCDPGIFIDGAINWLMQGGEEFIIAIDLRTEKYRNISVPSQSLYFEHYLCVLNDRLVCTSGYNAWILNGYGGKEIWTKFLSLETVGIKFSYFSRLVAYVKSKEEVLIRSNVEGFLWYHLKTGCVKKVTIKGFTLKQRTSCQVFPTSLIQLNGNKRKQTLIRSRKRVRLELTTSDV